MILAALPVLEAESCLNELFKPAINEDTVYEMAMRVHEDEIYAKRLVKIYADSKA